MVGDCCCALHFYTIYAQLYTTGVLRVPSRAAPHSRHAAMPKASASPRLFSCRTRWAVSIYRPRLVESARTVMLRAGSGGLAGATLGPKASGAALRTEQGRATPPSRLRWAMKRCSQRGLAPFSACGRRASFAPRQAEARERSPRAFSAGIGPAPQAAGAAAARARASAAARAWLGGVCE